MKKIKMWQTALIAISVVSFGVEYREALAHWAHPRPHLPKVAPYTVSILEACSIIGSKAGSTYRAPYFEVNVCNISGDTQQLWSEDCSWDSAATSLEVLAVDGKRLKKSIVVERTPFSHLVDVKIVPFEPKGKIHVELPMHEYIKGERGNRGMASERSDYRNFPALTAGNHILTVRAIFESRRRNLPDSDEVWTGRVASAPLDYTITGPYL